MVRNKRVWLGFLVTLVFLALLLRQVDVSRLWGALLGTNYLFLLPAIPFYFVGVWLRAVRWRHLLAPISPLSSAQLFPYVVIGYMANDVLPLRVGELVRTYLLGERHKLAKTSVLGTIALERISDGLTLVGFMACIALFVPLSGWMGQVLSLMALLFLGALALLALVLSSRERLQWLTALHLPASSARLYAQVRSVVGGFLDGMAALRRPQRLAAVAFYAVLVWISEAGVFYLVGWAMGLTIPLFLYVLAMAVANLATAVPSSQAGIGPFEYFCALTLILFGMDTSLAAAYALLVHVVLILPIVFLGLGYLWLEQLSLAQVVQRAGAQPAPSSSPPREVRVNE